MSQDNVCPYCGHDNESSIGVIPIGKGMSKGIDTSTIKCHNCKRTFGVN